MNTVNIGFIPSYCPGCGYLLHDVWFSETGYAKDALDKLIITKEPYTCICGVTLIYTRRAIKFSKPVNAAQYGHQATLEALEALDQQQPTLEALDQP
jgi:hypothetical protein